MPGVYDGWGAKYEAPSVFSHLSTLHLQRPESLKRNRNLEGIGIKWMDPRICIVIYIPYTILVVWYIYLHEWLTFMVNVGKYHSPMDGMIYSWWMEIHWISHWTWDSETGHVVMFRACRLFLPRLPPCKWQKSHKAPFAQERFGGFW